MTRHRYPRECAVFSFAGRDYEVIPDDTVGPRGFIVFDEAAKPWAISLAVWLTYPIPVPVNPAARELLAWARGGA